MKIKTSITNITAEGKEIIRGKELEQLIEQNTFSETIFLLFFKRLPNENEKRMWDALLVAAIDHGPAVTSAMTARISASAKNSTHTSLAAGILGFGERHGLAIEPAMKFFQEHSDDSDIASTLKQMKEQKKYAPGFGHKILKNDSRVEKLFEVAEKSGFRGKYCEFALKVHEELNKISSKPLPINIDGGMAAILCDMGVDYRLAQAIFLTARVPGLLAHIYEESTQGEGIYRLEEDEVEFLG